MLLEELTWYLGLTYVGYLGLTYVGYLGNKKWKKEEEENVNSIKDEQSVTWKQFIIE